MTAGEDTVAGATEYALGITGNDIRRLVEILGLVDDAVAQQEAVDRFQRDARDGVGHRTAAHPWRKLDGPPRGAAIEGQARLAVDVDQRQAVTGVDEIWIFNLGIGLPELRPLPWLTKIFARDVPECVARCHGVLLWKTLPELHLPVRKTCRGQE
ncbi:hypothetical protein D3C81_1716770 [compost metagenome]